MWFISVCRSIIHKYKDLTQTDKIGRPIYTIYQHAETYRTILTTHSFTSAKPTFVEQSKVLHFV